MILTEFLFGLYKKKMTITDMSAVVTGLLLALNLSTKVELWQCMIGSIFAIVVVKCFFGGIGCNIVNPAITARVVMLIAFAGTMTTFAPTNFSGVDAVSVATPLAAMKETGFRHIDLSMYNIIYENSPWISTGDKWKKN